MTPRPDDLPYKGDTVVGNDVWVGYDALLLPGVKVGDGAIVAARSVVTGDVPPYAVVGGNPAEVVKRRFPDEAVAELLAIRWWDWPVDKITRNLHAIGGADQFLLRTLSEGEIDGKTVSVRLVEIAYLASPGQEGSPVSETSSVVTLEDFEKLDIRVGRVVEVQPFPEGRYSTHILMIDFGPGLGTKKSLAKLAPNYEGARSSAGRSSPSSTSRRGRSASTSPRC